MTRPVIAKVGTPWNARSPKGKPWVLGRHTGEDFLASEGSVVVSTTPAVVTYVGSGGETAYGLHVITQAAVDGKVYRSIYAHLSHADVKIGQSLDTDQRIGLSGHTGHAFGPHLHYEVREFPFGFGNDVNPAVLVDSNFRDRAKPKPKKGTVTAFDVTGWNVASPRWFTPWKPRAAGIAEQIKGESEIYGFQEVYSEEQAKTISDALGGTFERVSGHAGLEFFYDGTKWELDPDHPLKNGGYASGVQGRYALVVHLVNKATGQHVAFVVVHAPALVPGLRTKYGRWLAKLLAQIDGPIVLVGDFNTSKHYLSPRKDVEALGYQTMRQQAAIEHGDFNEFPSKARSLADIYTRPRDGAKVTGGLIDDTSATLSDHRREEARVAVTAA